MNFKTKKLAIKALNTHSRYGVVFQYVKSGSWNWATMGSGIDNDLRIGNKILNPHASLHYQVPVQNIEYQS